MSSQGCSKQHISCIPFTPSYSVSEEMSSDAIVKHTKGNAVISSSRPGYTQGKSYLSNLTASRTTLKN